MKFISALISLVLVLTSNLPARADEIILTETDVKNAKILYKAWQEIDNFQNSKGPLKVVTHASKEIETRFITEFEKGVSDVTTKFSGYLDPDSEFHIIMASSYSEAERLINETIVALPDYSKYKVNHLNRADLYFNKMSTGILTGSTSSRGCWYKGNDFGITNGILTPCPKLKGGVIYVYSRPGLLINYLGILNSIGGHEAFHDILGIINPSSHYNTSEWIIEGTMQAIGLAVATKKSNFRERGTIFFPVPRFQGSPRFNLSEIDKDNMHNEIFSVTPIAVAYLIGTFGFKAYMNFIENMGFPNKGEDQLNEYFGISKSNFYEDFEEYSEWYYTRGVSILQKIDFETWELETPKKSKSKKKGKQKILFSCISKDGKTIKEFRKLEVKCPKGFKTL